MEVTGDGLMMMMISRSCAFVSVDFALGMSAGHLRTALCSQNAIGSRDSCLIHFGQSGLENEAKEVRVPPVKWSAFVPFVHRAMLGRKSHSRDAVCTGVS